MTGKTLSDVEKSELIASVDRDLDVYEDPVERENMRNALLESMGIDIDDNPAERGTEPVDPNKPADLGTAKAGEKDKVDPAPDADADAAAAAAAAEDGTKEKGPPDTPPADANPELDAAKARIAAQEAELAELRIRAALADSGDAISRQALENLKEQKTALDAAATREREQLTKLEGEYGADSEIAQGLRSTFAANATLREKQWGDLRQREVEKLTATRETEVRVASTVRQDIDAVPVLRDILAKSEDNPEMWAVAQRIDSHLGRQPEWMGKTRAERFAEVGRRMEPIVAATTATPAAPAKDTKDTKGDGKDKPIASMTDKELEAELARRQSKKAGGADDGTPLTLGDIDPGDTGGETAKLDELDPIAYQRMFQNKSLAEMDDMLLRVAMTQSVH